MIQSSSKFILPVIITTSLLTACGGSSIEETSVVVIPHTTTTTTITSSGPVWVKDKFTASADFSAQCENPRVGSSPITGASYQDKQGSELLEKHWQRAFNNETYLWYKEVIDNDPKYFNLTDYFAQLKTTKITDSGRDKDQFHFVQPTSKVEELSQLGMSYGYGIAYDTKQDTPPRKWIVQKVTTGTQAFSEGVLRGSTLLAIDDIDMVNTTSVADRNTIIDILTSSNKGAKHTFKFADLSGKEYQVELSSAAIKEVPLQIAKTIDTAEGKTGYLL